MLPKPPDGYLERSQADSLLSQFVEGKFYDGPVALPKRADPQQVDEYLKKVLDGDELTSRMIAQSGSLMRFFDLRSRAGQFPRLLNSREAGDEEFLRSMACIAILGDLGDEAQQKQAADYYAHMAGHRLAEPRYENVVDLFFHLPESADPKSISGPIENKMKALEPNLEAKRENKVMYNRLKNLRDDRLQRIIKAKARRHEIAKMGDAKRRRQELIRCYLRLELFAYVDFSAWCILMLQRDCNATKPEDLASAFSTILDRLMTTASVPGPTGQKLTGDAERTCVTSCAHAIEFYGGTLTDEQKEFVAKKRVEDQGDALHWDPRDD